MVSRKLAWSIVATALALTGCGESGPDGHVFPARDFVCPPGEATPCKTTEAARSEESRAQEPGTELDNETRLYVVNVLSIPEATGDTAPGFNLDGIDSGSTSNPDGATCEEFAADYVSLHDPDHIGVDNALAGLVSTIELALEGEKLDDLLAEQIEAGTLLILLEVSGIDSLDYDSAVQLQFFRAEIAGGAEPTIGSDGLLAADQTFDMFEALGPAVEGDIFEGRLRASTPQITIPIATDAITLDLVITNPEIRFDISDSGLSKGQIGGVLTVADLVSAAHDAFPDQADLVETAIGPSADVSPSADDPFTCEAISVGIAFDATTAARD